jgi:protein-S-isoprenylcysteine O-methyltransferase Ste14
MLPLVIWLGLIAAAGLIALSRGRRPLVDAWPAHLFALPLAVQISRLISNQHGLSALSLHDFAIVLQQAAVAVFLGLLVVLFALRSPVSGPHATWTQGLVALAGTFTLNVAGFLPVEPTTSTTSLLLSSGVVLAGTAFAVWSLAILGRCFGLFPEVRGLVLRGPYRWVRHPVYLGEIVAGVGVLIARPHLLTLGLLATFVAFQYWRTIYEERALIAAFTGEYTAYRALVPRLVPGLGRRTFWRPSPVAVG